MAWFIKFKIKKVRLIKKKFDKLIKKNLNLWKKMFKLLKKYKKIQIIDNDLNNNK